MIIRKVEGTYGNLKTKCTVLVADTNEGSWYCVVGSQNVNMTCAPLVAGVDVEAVLDVDGFTWGRGIGTPEELEKSIRHGTHERWQLVCVELKA